MEAFPGQWQALQNAASVDLKNVRNAAASAPEGSVLKGKGPEKSDAVALSGNKEGLWALIKRKKWTVMNAGAGLLIAVGTSGYFIFKDSTAGGGDSGGGGGSGGAGDPGAALGSVPWYVWLASAVLAVFLCVCCCCVLVLAMGGKKKNSFN